MPTRIEKLGELYDKAIENIAKRLEKSDAEMLAEGNEGRRRDMEIVMVYLQETKRPEQTQITEATKKLFAGMSGDQAERIASILQEDREN